jgi:hypothetical protein
MNFSPFAGARSFRGPPDAGGSLPANASRGQCAHCHAPIAIPALFAMIDAPHGPATN